MVSWNWIPNIVSIVPVQLETVQLWHGFFGWLSPVIVKRMKQVRRSAENRHETTWIQTKFHDKKAGSKDDGMMGKQCALQYIPSSLPSSGERPAKVVSPHNCTALIFLCGTNQSSNILFFRMHGQKWLHRKTKTKRLKMNGLLNGQFVRRLFFRLLLHPCDAVVCYEK